MPSQWSPASILTISQPEYTTLPCDRTSLPKINRIDSCRPFSCAGWAPSKNRECSKPISKPNRQCAAKLLAEMGQLDPLTTNLDSKLEDLAEYILCRGARHYESQHASLVAIWKEDIAQYRLRHSEGPAPVIAPLSENVAAPTTTEPATPMPTITAAAIESLMDSLTRQIAVFNEYNAHTLTATNLQDTPIPSVERNTLTTTSPLRQDRVSSSASSRFGQEGTPTPEPVTAPQSPIAQTVQATQDGDDETSLIAPMVEAPPLCPVVETESTVNDNEEANTNEAEEPVVDEAEDDEIHAAEEQATAAEVLPSIPNHNHNHIHAPQVHRRSVEGECCICQEDLCTNDDINDNNNNNNFNEHLTWCRGQCGQNFHNDCLAVWLVTQDDIGMQRRCPFCRGAWVAGVE